jgi:iron complex outermembrane recepter protein
VTDARIGYQPSGPWRIEVFAHNVLDARYITALPVQSGNSGLILGQTGDLRLLGVTLRSAPR